jgi:CheY-like chemotaxis protein
MFRLEVSDTGIGIREEDLPRLFVEFQQLDASAAKKYAGTGLGLALTKRIVEAQGGRVGVRSTVGAGTVFFAVLPREGRRPAATAKLPRVLIVDANEQHQQWLGDLLGSAGYQTEAVASGGRALAACAERTFDAIVLDLLVSDISWHEVLKRLRAEGANRDTPLIVVSVVPERGLGGGFHVHDMLTKPLAPDDLLRTLRRAAVAPDDARPILVVDDESQTLKLADVALRHLGYRPVCHRDAKAALVAATLDPPAAIVLDLLMPGLDGFEFLRQFRRTPGGQNTPVIVWTQKELTVADRRRLRALAEVIVVKSEGTKVLLEELRAHVPLPRGAQVKT